MSWEWQCMCMVPATWEAETGGSQVQDWPGWLGKFEASLGNRARFCHQPTNAQTPPNMVPTECVSVSCHCNLGIFSLRQLYSSGDPF
jgi:hypothetical protein